ncbi:urease accessory protein UreE [Haloarcula salina]|uniref:Urease accessory protein UreE n=1 Tax=Haloarcula salina TaxID=1429914 RepID=A0AA41KH76_9EURY|nr:urease accessory protein UreE [Haloarcula salina]MBV0903852.1 urease accessory protein UreE [Haloarcula salina]
MLVANTYVGHGDEEDVADRLAAADSVSVVLSDTERRRSRVRTETADGRDLGIVVARDLADGDVLEADDGTLVVVELAAIEALVLDLADSGIAPTAALELGHAVGNKHWDLAVRGDEALLPVTDSKARMEAAVEEHLPDVPTRYERVPPTTFDDGGADHSHGGDGHGHGDHSHADDGDHSHAHAHDEAHDHGVRTIDGGDP